MIQKTNPPSGSTAVAPMRQGTASEGPETWGQWVGHKHYSLEVVQNPLRARMCGFGDKDRRPLAPAAVAKMVVTRNDNSIVDVDEIDCSFFLVTVDLWSSDGKHEMNLVLHPTSADRYVPTSAPKAKRRATNANAPSSSRTGRQSPTSAFPHQHPRNRNILHGMTPYISPSTPGYPASAYPFPAQQPQPSESSFQAQPVNPYASQPDPNMPAWGYPPGASVDRTQPHFSAALPPIQSMSRGAAGPATSASYSTGASTAENWPLENQGRDDATGMPYRTWQQEPASYGQMAPTPTESFPQSRYSQEPYTPIGQQGPPQQLDGAIYPSAPYVQQPPPPPPHQAQPPAQYQQAPYVQDPTPPSTIPPLPRHTYTRTLVGPLSANACRLSDEHRKPGIFFLFQDLSIRTEGTFRLRLRLMNVGALPAPEYGAPCVHTDVSPVLAQTFTDPFIVYSAKRFPGVPDTTALSIALGNQGQKLPLRNRNGSNNKGRKRRRDNSGSEASGDESD
ncbi:velvet factor [Amylocystis lapponica]|nr:velvet factor [Amylocystis lapponica]